MGWTLNMKSTTLIAFAVCCVFTTWLHPLMAQEAKPGSDFVDEATRAKFQEELWFPVGEKLTYKLYWGIIPVGSAEFDSRWVMHDGKPRLSLQLRARTNKVVKRLFPVDDRIESIVDINECLLDV